MKLGERIAGKRKVQGMTQAELADKMHVTRQTVSRWEAGTVYPDIEKIAELANLLNVSCDYLLIDDYGEESNLEREAKPATVSRMLQNLVDKKVKLFFYDEEVDTDVLTNPCIVLGFEGNWMQVEILKKKGNMQKLVAVSSILSIEILTA